MTKELSANFDSALPLHAAAYRSWSSIKPAVMAWLWYLNAIYCIGFFYIPRPEAVWALTSYLAVGPLIVWTIARHRGLTRVSGLIHLPWAPFALYLGVRLFSNALGPPLSWRSDAIYYLWLHVVFSSTCICLAFDAWDLMRWRRGERFVLGTPAAAAAGASKLARQE